MSAKPKRGAKGAKGARRRPVVQTGCLHTNSGIHVTALDADRFRVAVHCPECGRTVLLTDHDAGSILALVGGF